MFGHDLMKRGAFKWLDLSLAYGKKVDYQIPANTFCNTLAGIVYSKLKT